MLSAVERLVRQTDRRLSRWALKAMLEQVHKRVAGVRVTEANVRRTKRGEWVFAYADFSTQIAAQDAYSARARGWAKYLLHVRAWWPCV